MNPEFLLINFGGWGVLAFLFAATLKRQWSLYDRLIKRLDNHMHNDEEAAKHLIQALSQLVNSSEEQENRALARHETSMAALQQAAEERKELGKELVEAIRMARNDILNLGRS